MRVFYCCWFLLLSIPVFSDGVHQHWVKPAELKPVNVYLYADKQDKLCASTLECQQIIVSQEWQQLCADDCIDGLSWQAYFFHRLTQHKNELQLNALKVIDSLTDLSDETELLCHQNILLWYATIDDYWRSQSIVEQLAQQNVQIVLLVKEPSLSLETETLLAIEEYAKHERLGFSPLTINVSQDLRQLSKQFKHLLQRAQYASQFNSADMQITGVSYVNEELIVQASKAVANSRWVADVYRLSLHDAPRLQNLSGLHIQANGELNWDLNSWADFSVSRRRDNQIDTVWLENVAIGSNRVNRALADYLDVNNEQQIKNKIDHYLQGNGVFNQPLGHELLDSPNHAVLLLEKRQGNDLIYASSDGSLHYWSLEQQAESWLQYFSSQSHNLILQDFWDLGKRSARYTGQLSAIHNKIQQKSMVFYGAGGAEKAIYHWKAESGALSLQWRIEAKNEFAELAQVEQKILGIELSDNGNKRMAVLTGAGLDPLYTHSQTRPAIAQQGNAIYLIETDSGRLLWKASYGEIESSSNQGVVSKELKHAFAATATVNSTRDTAIFADMGGQLWQLMLPQCGEEQCLNLHFKQENWLLRRLAKTEQLQAGFFYPAVSWKKGNKDYLAAVTGSVKQHQFNDSTLFLFLTQDDEVALEQLSSLIDCEANACLQGWKYTLAAGEMPTTELLIEENFLYLVTHQEQPQSCIFVADKYRIYRFNLSSKNPDFKYLELSEGSLYLSLNSGNADFMLPLINRYFDGEHESLSVKQALENANVNSTNSGIVISSWREYFY